MLALPFRGRLFGPGITGGGVAATGHWQGDVLALRAGDLSLQVPASALQIEAAGFNAGQIRICWRSDEGEFACFIEHGGDKEQFFAHAPQTIAAHAASVNRGRRRVDSRFHAAIGVYALILALPLLLLALFLLNTDRMAGWVARHVPVEYEAKIGRLALAQARAQNRLLDSGPAYDAVRAIGTRLTAGSRYTYQWFVAEGQEVNAFAAPGGVVVVYAGLIAQTGQAEELAGVIAHEVAHVEQRHGLRNLVKRAGFGVLLSLAMGDWSGSTLGAWIANLTNLKFSRDAEMEADREGLRRMVEAGIAPDGMPVFFTRMAQREGESVKALSFFSTHPPSQQRLDSLRQQIAALPPRQYEPLAMDWPRVKASLRNAQNR